MTLVQEVLSRKTGSRVHVGDIVAVPVDLAIVVDLQFLPQYWRHVRRVWDPEKVVVVFDHLAPAADAAGAATLQAGRRFVQDFGITRFHDVGPLQGISHQLVAEHGYAGPGDVVVCLDSHTAAAGSFGCAARGVGAADMLQVLTTGATWFELAPTIRYDASGRLGLFVGPKDVFLHLAHRHGDHYGFNVEVGGELGGLSLDARRALSTMAVELNVEFSTFEADEVVVEHLRARGKRAEPLRASPGSTYADRRLLDLTEVVPYVARPHRILGNVTTAAEAAGERLDQGFIGSCAHGSFEELAAAAEVLRGRKVARGFRLIVTPASNLVYRRAAAEGLLEELADAGATITAPSCGACAGLGAGSVGAGERCITASTRNFRGRMGSSEAELFMASPATVAASAIRGAITDPRDLA